MRGRSLATMEGASVTKVLDGRVALVTGAGRGLGLEIAKGLAAEGAIVLVNGRNREHLERAVGEITAADGTAYAASFDVTDDEAVTSAIGDAVRVHGRLDVLIGGGELGGGAWRWVLWRSGRWGGGGWDREGAGVG